MAVYGGPDIVTSGLVLHLDAGNTKSYPGTGNTWYDLSGNNRNFTLVGNIIYEEFYFDGFGANTEYVTGSSYSHRTNNFTYSFWMMWDASADYDTLVENGFWTDTLLLRFQGSTGIAVYCEGALYGSLDFVPVVSTWHNIVFRRNGTVIDLFVDNTYKDSVNFNADHNLAYSTMNLMKSTHSTVNNTNGKLSTFQIYSKALSNNEIEQNYNALKGRYNL
jgi:hypothetical protein